jgi:hypothetical protein
VSKVETIDDEHIGSPESRSSPIAQNMEGLMMLPRGGFEAKASRGECWGTEVTPDAIAALAHGDAAKIFVLSCISQLLARGCAERRARDSDEIELRFGTGETFILTESAILRVA